MPPQHNNIMLENNHIVKGSNELLIYAPEKTPRCLETILEKYGGRIEEQYFNRPHPMVITSLIFENPYKKDEFEKYLNKPTKDTDASCFKKNKIIPLTTLSHASLKYKTYNDALGYRTTTKDKLQLIYDIIHHNFKKELTLKKYPVMIIQSVSMAGLAYASYPTINEPLFIMSFAAMNINLGIYTGYIAHKIHKIKREIEDTNNFEK